jgi:hypothetical protein
MLQLSRTETAPGKFAFFINFAERERIFCLVGKFYEIRFFLKHKLAKLFNNVANC